ncbi:MAG: hypothetical protein QW733_06085 [Desulfurococcaceae archaeon]
MLIVLTHMAVFFVSAFLSFLITNDIRTKQIDKLRQELQECKSAYSNTKIIAEECQAEISKLRVDYQKRIREFHKAIQQRNKYEALQNVRVEAGDECESLRHMLDEYRNIELK